MVLLILRKRKTMANFDINLEHMISSELNIKASGSIIEQAQEDLNLPDGNNIEQLLADEKNIKNQT
jgi:hypothetical protein